MILALEIYLVISFIMFWVSMFLQAHSHDHSRFSRSFGGFGPVLFLTFLWPTIAISIAASFFTIGKKNN
jgi:hypothetical protein